MAQLRAVFGSANTTGLAINRELSKHVAILSRFNKNFPLPTEMVIDSFYLLLYHKCALFMVLLEDVLLTFSSKP